MDVSLILDESLRNKKPNQLRNLMVSRMVSYLVVLSLLRLCWVIEQPASSLLEFHPLFQWLVQQFDVFRAPWLPSCHEAVVCNVKTWIAAALQFGLKAFVWIGSYGGDCPFAARSSKQEAGELLS